MRWCVGNDADFKSFSAIEKPECHSVAVSPCAFHGPLVFPASLGD